MESTRANVRELLLRMLRREDELRLCDATQRRYAARAEDGAWKEKVTVDVQRRVCAEFGFEGAGVSEGLDLLRSATALFPDDEELLRSAHWLRHNICAPCPLDVGAIVPDVPLYFARDAAPGAAAQTSVRELAARNRSGPTVLVVGSHT